MPTLCERDTDLSIIIPVYNLERFLSPMLRSLKAQDLGEYSVEIIFVLNNCTDDSEGVIDRSCIECKVISCTTQGCGPARNAGLEIAQGRYVWMMDGDDWLISNTAVRDAMDVAVGQDIIRVPFKSDLYNYQYFSMVWQYVMRRDFIKEFSFPDYQPAEDDAYMLQVLAKAGRDMYSYMELPHVDRALYYYNYLREGSNMYRHYLGEKI